MAISKGTKKAINRATVARAVKVLRNRLGWAQPKLARAISEGLDRGTLSRWERGEETPHPATREVLAQIAKGHGWHDLVGAFLDPVANWKEVIFTGDERHLLALFEMVVINREMEPGDGGLISQKQFGEIARAVLAAVRSLKRAHAAGEHVDIVGEEQTAAWLAEIAPKKAAISTERGSVKRTKAARRTKA